MRDVERNEYEKEAGNRMSRQLPKQGDQKKKGNKRECKEKKERQRKFII